MQEGTTILQLISLWLDAGTGETHLNTILTTLNIPPMSRSTFKRREREVGLAVEHVAKK